MRLTYQSQTEHWKDDNSGLYITISMWDYLGDAPEYRWAVLQLSEDHVDTIEEGQTSGYLTAKDAAENALKTEKRRQLIRAVNRGDHVPF